MNPFNLRLHLIVLTYFGCVCSGLALDDGIYLLRDGNPESDLRLQGGTPGRIERILKQSEYILTVVSQSNRNERFQVRLDDNLPADAANINYLAIALDGTLYSVVGALSDSLQSLTKKPVLIQVDEPLAVRIAAIAGGMPILRKHISQKVSLRFITERELFHEGDPITVSVEVKNLGVTPIVVGIEYQTGDNRSSQLVIVPSEESASNCTDVRSRTARSSSVDNEIIGPGEVTTIREESLRRWYEMEKPGQYHFIGIYKFRIYEREGDKYPCWVEHCASDFEFEYSKK